jgi:Acetyltransferase (GNAT) domain
VNDKNTAAIYSKSITMPVGTDTQAAALNRCREMTVQPADQLRYLNPDEYPAWDLLVDASLQGNVFCRSWWLRALPGDVRMLGCFRGGNLAAGIPLYFEHWLKLTFCRMPKLVHTWGVVMQPAKGKTSTLNSREMEILAVFAKTLAKQRYFAQSFHPSLSNWLPFYWEGFRQTTHFGYVLELTDRQRIWDGMASNVRQNIRKAEKMGMTIIPCDSKTVAAAAEKTFHAQHKPLPYSYEYVDRLYSAAEQNDSGACFSAVDQKGRVHGGIFLVWDWKRAYFVAGGTDPELRTSGAYSMLLWHAFNFLLERAAVFDFAGSVVEGIENFFRHFGAKLVPYNRITKLPRLARACMVLAGVQ